MSWTEKLAAVGKGYRLTWNALVPDPCLTGPDKALGPQTTIATDEQIERWISKRIANGERREDIEAALEARIADVASGYEDAWQ